MKYIIIAFLLLAFTNSIAQNRVVEEIIFEGIKRVDESFLRRLIKVQPSQTYDSLKVTTDIERLNRLPAIANATVKKVNKEDGFCILTYRIVENFTIIPGLRISEANDESFAFRASVFEFNFLGQSQIVGGFYQRDVFNSYGVYWEAPYLLTNKLGFGINYQKNVTFEPIYFEETVNYKQVRSGADLYGMYEIDFHNRIEVGVQVFKETYETTEEISLGSMRPSKLKVTKAVIRAEYEHNFLDVLYQYTSGYRNLLDIRYVTGGEGLLADAFIAKNSTSFFKRLGRKGNWASRLSLGYASFNASDFTPFSIDNQQNLRGAGNDVDRGTSFVFINTEYRQTLFEKDWFALQSNVFIDAGTLRQPRGDLNQLVTLNNVEAYSGLGLRFIHRRIFNAVLRVDYGIGLGSQGNRGLVFGIGQYF